MHVNAFLHFCTENKLAPDSRGTGSLWLILLFECNTFCFNRSTLLYLFRPKGVKTQFPEGLCHTVWESRKLPTNTAPYITSTSNVARWKYNQEVICAGCYICRPNAAGTKGATCQTWPGQLMETGQRRLQPTSCNLRNEDNVRHKKDICRYATETGLSKWASR